MSRVTATVLTVMLLCATALAASECIYAQIEKHEPRQERSAPALAESPDKAS